MLTWRRRARVGRGRGARSGVAPGQLAGLVAAGSAAALMLGACSPIEPVDLRDIGAQERACEEIDFFANSSRIEACWIVEPDAVTPQDLMDSLVVQARRQYPSYEWDLPQCLPDTLDQEVVSLWDPDRCWVPVAESDRIWPGLAFHVRVQPDLDGVDEDFDVLRPDTFSSPQDFLSRGGRYSYEIGVEVFETEEDWNAA